MLKLTDDMKDLLKHNLCYIATASKDGMPCVAPKSCRFTDDGRLYYIEWAGKKTYANLVANPKIAISACSADKKTNYRFEGGAEVQTSGPVFDHESKRRAEAGKRAVVAIVMVDVTDVFDMGKKDPGGRVEL